MAYGRLEALIEDCQLRGLPMRLGILPEDTIRRGDMNARERWICTSAEDRTLYLLTMRDQRAVELLFEAGDPANPEVTATILLFADRIDGDLGGPSYIAHFTSHQFCSGTGIQVLYTNNQPKLMELKPTLTPIPIH